MHEVKLSRRGFLQISAGLGACTLIAACAPAPQGGSAVEDTGASP